MNGIFKGKINRGYRQILKAFFYRTVPFVFILAFVVATISANIASTPTMDEFAHLPAGYVYIKKGDFSLYHKNPPLIKMMSALPLTVLSPEIDFQWKWDRKNDWTPWIFGKYFMENNRAAYEDIFFWGRIPILLLSLLLAYFVYRWAHRLYGKKSALLALFLYLFSPNIIAHSSLATIDIGASLFILVSMYIFLAFLKAPNQKRLLFSGLVLGFAQLSKFTAIFLFIMFPLCGMLFMIWKKKYEESPFLLQLTEKVRLSGWKALSVSILLIYLLGLAVLNAGYGFEGSFKQLGDYQFESTFFQNLGKSGLSFLPVPLPHEYLAGFDDQKNDVEFGEFPNFFMGKWSEKGWWYYLPFAFIVKTPLALSLFLLFLFFSYLFKKEQIKIDEIFLIIPILLLFFVFAFLSNLNTGIRYLLPLFPFLFILMSRILREESEEGQIKTAMIILLAGWYAYSSLSVFPHYLSHFNELVGGPKNGYKYLIDSNIDWGQDLKGLKKYMDQKGIKHIKLAYFGSVDPEIYGISYEIPKGYPERGIYAISANYLQGLPYPVIYGKRMIEFEKGYFSWLKHYQPVTNIGNSIFIFNL